MEWAPIFFWMGTRIFRARIRSVFIIVWVFYDENLQEIFLIVVFLISKTFPKFGFWFRKNIFEGKNRTATFAHRICENTEEDVTFLNLNPYFCGFRSGAASSHPLRNLSRSHFHNQCHPFILRYDSHPHHPTHQRVIVSRYFTKFLPFFSRANCWSRILSTPVVVLLFILELPSSFFPIKSWSGIRESWWSFFMFLKSHRHRGTKPSCLGWKIKNLKIVFKKWSFSSLFEPVLRI